jgi:proline iminopeptidase
VSPVAHSLYPPIEPYASGMLAVSDGNQIYWETSGTEGGTPALAIHGGPGSGSVPGMRRPFNPDQYRVVLFDQRSCGRSTPHASDPTVDLSTNTTDHLIADIETLRTHLGIDRWMLVGWSWGTTLALAYAQAHPDRVAALVLVAVTTTSPSEVRWITHDVGRLFPAEWNRFRDALPDADRESHINLGPIPKHVDRYADPKLRMCFARLVTHYWRHGAWRAEGELLRGVAQIDHIPAVLIHGRLDLSSPPDVPWKLAQAWPAADLHIVPDAGHTAGDAISEHVVAALDNFASLID